MQTPDRLARQLEFLLEIDRLKEIQRRSYLASGVRRENSAEHSWHVALFALLLAEHANEPVDTARVVRLLLIHDIVEIDAGDTFLYDAAGAEDKHQREAAAAQRLYSLLPDDQAAELLALWREFEARQTPEARFAAAIDRLQPLLLNLSVTGRTWREHDICYEQVIEANRHMANGSDALWAYARTLLDQAREAGILRNVEPERP